MSYVIGLNIGANTVGWAIARWVGTEKILFDTGMRVFDTADKGDITKHRHKLRVFRRKIRRKKHRIGRVRQLLLTYKIISKQELNTLFNKADKDIYAIRSESLDRYLYRDEWARLLIHLAQRRGFATSDATPLPDHFRTIGEMLYHDPRFRTINEDGKLKIKTRNSSLDYRFTPNRAQLIEEIKTIFNIQRGKGNLCALEHIEREYLEIFCAQRDFEDGPGQGSPYKNSSRGFCPIYKREKRMAKACYLNELVRLYSNLNLITIKQNGERPLSADERHAIVEIAHKYNSIRYSDIQKIVGQNVEAILFKNEQLEQFKVLTSFHRIKKFISLDQNDPKQRDILNAIAEILTSYKSLSRREHELRRLDINESAIAGLVKITFFGSAFLSKTALSEILPRLQSGLRFTEAYEAFKAGALVRRKKKLCISDCTVMLNSTVKRALSQAFKVINALIKKYGAPRQIAVNLMDDIKSHKKRDISNSIDELANIFGELPQGINLIKARLWHEQKGFCPYSGTRINKSDVFKPDVCEIDHIVPFSRSFDDTYANKLLVKKGQNANKSNLTAYEYISRNPDMLNRYIHYANSVITDRVKRRNMFRSAAVDTCSMGMRGVFRVVKNMITDSLRFEQPFDLDRRVLEINGQIIQTIAASLPECGLDPAVYAALSACATEKYFSAATTAIDKGAQIPMPYDNFLSDLNRALDAIFVSRMPLRKATGRAHKETIRSSRGSNAVTKVELQRLRLDKNKEIEGYYKPETDILLYNALKERLVSFAGDAEFAFIEPFYKPKSDGQNGPIVKKVKLFERPTLAVPVRGGNGVAANGSMIRIDIFMRDGKYFFVPIYVSDTVKPDLPNRAVIAHKPYHEWQQMRENEFLFTLYQNELISVTHRRGMTLKGKTDIYIQKDTPHLFYYLGANISAGTISIVTHNGSHMIGGLGIKTLANLEKYSVDLLGNYYKEKCPQVRQKFKRKKHSPST